MKKGLSHAVLSEESEGTRASCAYPPA